MGLAAFQEPLTGPVDIAHVRDPMMALDDFGGRVEADCGRA